MRTHGLFYGTCNTDVDVNVCAIILSLELPVACNINIQSSHIIFTLDSVRNVSEN